MSTPRLEIDLGKIEQNTRTLVERLARRNISVTGVTKASLGSPEIARAMLSGGAIALGDSRIENIEAMRRAKISAPMTLIRCPMLSQVERVVLNADVSFNTEVEVIGALSAAAQKAGTTHAVVLMVELGDLREGIMPCDIESTVRETLQFPNIELRGIATNLACRSGVKPDARNMAELSAIAVSIEGIFGLTLAIVSGGNSANIPWVLGGEETGRINDLRLGEALLLGREPLHRQAIDGLHTDAITLVAEVIESKVKPSQPWGEIGQSAFGPTPPAAGRGDTEQAIFALGRQDTDPDGLSSGDGIELLGASSDHLIADCGGRHLRVGTEITFQLNYSALMRAMTSPFVAKVTRDNCGDIPVVAKLPAEGNAHFSLEASPSSPEPQRAS